jgi:hypothetical protein
VKTTLTILVSILLCFNLCAAKSIVESEVPAEAKETQVVIIGTIHSTHHKNPKYSPEVLKEIIVSLKPDIILNELPLSLVNPNGRPIEQIRGRDSDCPEVWAADQAAMELGVKQIPFDRRDREKNRQETDFYKKRKRSGEQRDKWLKEIKKDNPEAIELKISVLQDHAGQAQEHLRFNAGPKLINSDAFDSIIRVKDSVWEDILPVIMGKHPQHKHSIDDLHFLINEWQERNAIMANNIAKAAKQNPGKRIVVITGATHRYILRRLLKDKKVANLREFWEIMEVDNNNAAESGQSDIKTKQDTIKEIATSVTESEGSTRKRVIKLVKWMNQNFKWTSTDYKKRTVEEIIQRRGGNCAEQARVLIALLKASGIEARWVEEINIQPESKRRHEDAEKLIAEHGHKLSIFGYIHNDHRWLEVYDDAFDVWIPADPTLGVFGVKEWVRVRLGFGERPEAAKDMIVPFVVIIREKGQLVQDRSEHYLINEFNAYYGNELGKLSAWPQWLSTVLELSKLGSDAFAGEINLHEHTKLMIQLEQAYLNLKKEYLTGGSG